MKYTKISLLTSIDDSPPSLVITLNPQSNNTIEESGVEVLNLPNNQNFGNVIISWNFKHLVVRRMNEMSPILVHNLKKLVEFNFFAIDVG